MLLLLGFSVGKAHGAKVELTLEEAFRLVETENFRILLEQEVVEEALQMVFASRSALFPTIDFQAAQHRTQFVMKKIMNIL